MDKNLTQSEKIAKLKSMGYKVKIRKDGYTRVFDDLEVATDPDMGFCVSGIYPNQVLDEALRLNQ